MKDGIHAMQSDHLYAEFTARGAEMISLFSKKTRQEYLWRPNPAVWNQSAPILFPIVGRLKNGKYTYKGKSYMLPPHGFVSNALFTTDGPLDNTLTYSFSDTKDTRALFPFKFTLNIIYTLKWNQLEIVYQVVNKTDGPMYFSCGSHEGYVCPRNEDEAFEDYYLEFEAEESYKSLTVTADGLLSREEYPVIEKGKVLPLNYDLFDNDSLVFADIPSSKVMLCSKKSKTKIEVKYEDAPNLVLWTQRGAKYICIEPWDGLPDFEDGDGTFENKTGIVMLEKAETYNWRHTIVIYEALEDFHEN